ncbi:serine/threonine-protein kinase [Streptomyces sp. NPDC047108]|uniref:serine/threonine-protein kinase n=1 Tax=Streptomyces sp. NPDC047108 TaxID=3155025 RepID=UPI00340431FC
MNTRGAGRRLVDGRFELIARLGSGGMGTVWRALDTALHREVALKEVRPPDPALAEADPHLVRTARERVLREARALARLDHPHVVTIHHIVEPADGSHPWLVMELVRGGCLADRLAQGSLPTSEVLRLGRGVLSALRAAHAAGIHHRDVKPANVLLRTDGSPVLTDFGIAALRESTSLTATGDLIGSPEYIAPERIRGVEGDPASDLWSLGMLLYVCAEGAHPLRRATSLATLVAVLDEPIPPPVRSGPLAPVLAELLVRDVAARPDAARLDMLLENAQQAAGAEEDAVPGAGVGFADGAGFTKSMSLTQSAGLTDGSGTPDGAGSGEVHDAVPTPYQVPYVPVQPVLSTPSATPQNPYARPPSDQVLPGVFGPAPGHGPPPGALPPRRKPRRPFVAGLAAVAVAVTVTTVVVLIPREGSAGATDRKEQPAASDTSGAAKKRPSETEGEETVVEKPVAPDHGGDLLTPSGMRDAVKAFRSASGRRDVVDLTVYPEYAMASIPSKSRSRVYDEYEFREEVATRTGPGSTLDSDDVTVDLSKIDWDILPKLMKKAEKELGVAKPTSRYVIVDTDIISHVASLRIYLTDDYGAAYLSADLKGRVQRIYRRD